MKITRLIRRYCPTALLALFTMIIAWTSMIPEASAIPAFARKFNVSCNVCHTRPPRLNPFGQRFQENGYQIPGTSDGSVSRKRLLGGELGGATLDAISNYMAVRLRADIQQASFRDATITEASDDIDIILPNIVNIFFAGTASDDISFFFEAEYASQGEGVLAFERAFLIFDNLGGHQVANIKIGKFDPAAMYSFPTHRQQINPIGPKADTDAFPPTINRIPLLPLAFSSKMFGLSRGQRLADSAAPTDPDLLSEGFAILPFEPMFYNAPVQNGISIHGRPFGSNFLYQVGIVQAETAENQSQTTFDTYVMLRYDWLGEYSDLSVSGFIYNADKAAMPTLNPAGTLIYATDAVDWQRYGIAARWTSKWWDIYGTIIWDEIDTPVFAMAPASLSTWDTDAMGISIEADYLLNAQWLLGVRYDSMDTGGLSLLPPALQAGDPAINQDASFIAVIAKYYPRPSIGLYARYHQNLESSVKLPTNVFGGVEHPARNLKSMITVGVDMAF